MVIHTKKASHK